MNNSYYSSSSNDYSALHEYSFGYASPSTNFYSPSACPIHSPNFYYLSPSMNISPVPYIYHQPQVFSPPVQQEINIADRTPLRRHQCFKTNELQILYQSYIRDSHPSIDILQQLATQLKVTVDKVRQWYKNRRHSDKKKKREVPTT